MLPQVLPEIVAFWLYRFEINLRAAAVMGVIGAGGIGQLLHQTLQYRRWEQAGMVVLVIIVATILVDRPADGCADASSRAPMLRSRAKPRSSPTLRCWADEPALHPPRP